LRISDLSERFEEEWKRAATFRNVSPHLRTLLERLYDLLTVDEIRNSHLADIRAALIELFEFLSSGARTDANCSVSDHFFAEAEQWSQVWPQLPGEYQRLLSDAGGVLHDSIHAPAVAATFGCLPEQLLIRARALPISR
jgi:hypothetical protein